MGVLARRSQCGDISVSITSIEMTSGAGKVWARFALMTVTLQNINDRCIW